MPAKKVAKKAWKKKGAAKRSMKKPPLPEKEKKRPKGGSYPGQRFDGSADSDT